MLRVIRRVLQRPQPDRSKSDSEWVTAISTRNAPSVSTDRPGTGSDRIWVRSFANTVLNLPPLPRYPQGILDKFHPPIHPRLLVLFSQPLTEFVQVYLAFS